MNHDFKLHNLFQETLRHALFRKAAQGDSGFPVSECEDYIIAQGEI